jgi:hypothetical protein
MSELLLDLLVASIARDHAWIPRRPPAAQQRPARPGDPPKVEEIIAVMCAGGHRPHGTAAGSAT